MSTPTDDQGRVTLDTTVGCPVCQHPITIAGGFYESAEVYETVGLAAARRHALDTPGHDDLVAELSDVDDVQAQR